MVVAAFSLTKINVERKKVVEGKVNVNSDTVLRDVVERSVNLGKTKQSGLDFVFTFTAQYLNEAKAVLASIVLEGEVLYLEEPNKIKMLLDGWKKNKTVEKEVLKQVMNTVLSKCTVEGILLSKEISLPPPINLPIVQG